METRGFQLNSKLQKITNSVTKIRLNFQFEANESAECERKGCISGMWSGFLVFQDIFMHQVRVKGVLSFLITLKVKSCNIYEKQLI